MREKKKFPALPLGLKSEVPETRMKFHRISRGRDFLKVPGRAFTVLHPDIFYFYPQNPMPKPADSPI